MHLQYSLIMEYQFRHIQQRNILALVDHGVCMEYFTLVAIGSATCIGCDGKMFRVSAKRAIDNVVSAYIRQR